VAEWTRSAFMKAGALALLGFGSVPRFLVRAAYGERRATRPRILIAIFQRGAVDGLSMVVPHAAPEYYAARSSIAIARPAAGAGDAVIDLDGFFGLHPALGPLKPLWDAGRLAAVHACGSPDHTRSHFDAQEYMESGTPGVKGTPDGWLGRALEMTPGAGGSPLRAVALAAHLPRSLWGGAGTLALTNVSDFEEKPAGPPDEGSVDLWRGFASMYRGDKPDLVVGTARESFAALKVLRTAAPQEIPPANGAEYPHTRFGESLKQIAQLIKADVGLEVAFTDVGGWDTHVGQGDERGRLAFRFKELGDGLAALDRDLGDRMDDVVVLTMSEFGRTVRENGSRGTDHGHATAMLVLGGRVRGGSVHGRWPGLAPEQLFEARDLAVTTDFRDLFAEIAVGHLGVPATAAIFAGRPVDPARFPRVLR
jgi:uncharacterized protein (DUF1501 family)